MPEHCPNCHEDVQPIAHRSDRGSRPVWFLVCPMDCDYVFGRIEESDFD